jgi:hypothetical protein
MTTGKRNTQLASFVIILSLGVLTCGQAREGANTAGQQEQIKAYCIDFNWALRARAGFAQPGTWKDADPKEHVEWYKAVGANVIQTFAVSCNGYAWYKSEVIPEQPGLKHDFLTEVVKLGHAEGMKVMGYFCIASNTRWGEENPDLSYGTPSAYHIPYTDEYLDFLSSSITDAIKTTGIDGFMIDWVWMPKRKATNDKWIDAEKKLYQQLMGEPFPGEEKITKEQNLAYSRKAIDRCWKAIRKAAKTADPDCIIWLTTNNVNHPHVKDSDMYKEVDWLMGEKGKLDEILKLKPMVGKHTRLITCFSDFGGGNALKDIPEALNAGLGMYGYAKPDPSSQGGTIDLNRVFSKQLTQLHGNDLRISVLARAYRGASIGSIWKDGEFIEPEVPLPFEIKFRKRSSRHPQDSGRVDVEVDSTLISVVTPNQKGRLLVTRKASRWPKKVVVRLNTENRSPKTKNAKLVVNEIRVANGEIGIAYFHKEKPEVIAGKMKEKPSLNQKPWASNFLNEGKPESPIEVGPVEVSTEDHYLCYTVPSVVLEGNPSEIVLEWGVDGHVF